LQFIANIMTLKIFYSIIILVYIR